MELVGRAGRKRGQLRRGWDSASGMAVDSFRFVLWFRLGGASGEEPQGVRVVRGAAALQRRISTCEN